MELLELCPNARVNHLIVNLNDDATENRWIDLPRDLKPMTKQGFQLFLHLRLLIGPELDRSGDGRLDNALIS